MKIALASDHAGYDLKIGIVGFLKKRGIEFKDFGCGPGEKVDYVDYAEKAIQMMEKKEFDRAILVCGTGLGMSIVANKYRGIRATPCWDEYVAEMSRKHNDSNCITLGGRILPLDEALQIVQIWLDTHFEEGRHQMRLEKLLQVEEKNFKSKKQE
ncbi:MAG: ribose 5-phosphate isomerase B [Acidobacteriota bacterium]|nr:ribose 5-phosphate isomerase B [Acidobacteriota bacterium]